MNISPKERFLDICHFKRPSDLWLSDSFWQKTLGEWEIPDKRMFGRKEKSL